MRKVGNFRNRADPNAPERKYRARWKIVKLREWRCVSLYRERAKSRAIGFSVRLQTSSRVQSVSYSMSKLGVATSQSHCPRTSGVHRRLDPTRMSTTQDEVSATCRQKPNQGPCDLWQCVEHWLARLDSTDQRRRLLEMAQWRQDVTLAQSILRQL